ncbi:transcription elongation factor Spt6 [Schizophyllum commune H4-8]|uniref:Transcription elongation factor Spt6 n=1 Tax=Schizophyllum commune (strain H4-8 / FGSC 9210) TaxID=578458 RepID=D8PTB3_SCHCM|nr:transcription elongation factor Spt6 [Schizophyllum commune H4-8]KAI5899362.1 transcription elongation factor Spt6 [Schizophyllum commune H4-8]
MSSPPPAEYAPEPVGEDVPMQDAEQQEPPPEDEDAEGDVVMPGADDDSSEEGEDDEEEERRIRQGFIVDEDEEEEEDEEEARRERRSKRRKKKHRHRRREEEEALEEDDLELLEENTGTSFRRNNLTRLRRGRDSESPPAGSRRRKNVIDSDDDLDDDIALPKPGDVQAIFDDDRGRDDDEEYGSDDFIDYDEEEDGAMDEETRQERREERRRQEAERRRRVRSALPQLAGIDAGALDEMHDIFGGDDYDWALEADEEIAEPTEQPETRYQDVFEPSEIRNRLLTEDDDLIRAQDIPERMQLTSSGLSGSSAVIMPEPFSESDVQAAALWVTQRISNEINNTYFGQYAKHRELAGSLIMAVTYAIRAMFVSGYEVPYIWTHKRDHIIHFDAAKARESNQDEAAMFGLLSLDDLWRIYTLGQKFRALLERKRSLTASYARLKVEDDYYDTEIFPKLESVESIADATEWLMMKYKDKKQDADTFRFHDDNEEQIEAKKHKRPSRISAYEVAKNSIASRVAHGFGLTASQIVENFHAVSKKDGKPVHFIEEFEQTPLAYAEQHIDPDPTKAKSPEELLAQARLILSTELGKDPNLRQAIRDVFKSSAVFSVSPTERGITKIDVTHPFYAFKYLLDKPITEFLDTPQFLQILAAESEHLVTVSISLSPLAQQQFEDLLNDACTSDAFGESSKLWNAERRQAVHDAVEQHLIPAGRKWVRDYLREEIEDAMANKCGTALYERIHVAPWKSQTDTDTPLGAVPAVLAVSWGKGDVQRDPIHAVFVDSEGRMRDYTQLENFHTQQPRDEFVDLIRRRNPDVIVIGGFSMATTKLSQRIKEILGEYSNQGGLAPKPVVYVPDDVARIYQHSRRAAEEFTTLPTIARYCVGLARYTQGPLNEFAALGSDVTAITLDEDLQQWVPKEKLLTAFERRLVDVTNKVGVDINRAVTDPYYQHLLPFVCGLGPRKAQALVKKISAMGGSLTNREQFIKKGLLTTRIFLNAAGFLRINVNDMTSSASKKRAQMMDVDEELASDPLDNTRIHPEDYELARKMAADALEYDEEDLHDVHPSHVVSVLMKEPDRQNKLNDLNLVDFAISLLEANNEPKRHTLGMIRSELVNPFCEYRDPFPLLEAWDVLTMLSGETYKTLRRGLIVSAAVMRIQPGKATLRLDSGVEAYVTEEYAADRPGRIDAALQKGQIVSAVVIEHKFDIANDSLMLELSTRPMDLAPGDEQFRKVKPDMHWDDNREDKDKDIVERRKRAEERKTRRVVKHPDFHNFNSKQAEEYLENQNRGDVVIRPSSKGTNHLAVTWKVDDGLYQHINVMEPNADAAGTGVSNQLIVDPTHVYSDLDELIVNHVQAMARRVDDLMAHERFKKGPEDELHLYLKQQLAANPKRSMYGFTLNRKKPGHFNLCFLASKGSTVQSWPVRVAPEAYYLFDAAAVGVSELCDAFKVRHLHESQNLANGGKTPYPGAGGRTPARGHATPGHMTSRGRTPNPYAGGVTPRPPPPGGVTPRPPPPPNAFPGGPAPPPNAFGAPPMPPAPGFNGGWGAVPPAPPGGMVPPGMNPQRAAMLQQAGGAGGWGGGSGGWGQ